MFNQLTKSIFFIAIISVFLLSTGCAHAPTKAQSATQPEVKDLPIPTQYKDSVKKEFALSKVIKIYDDIAWLGTDAIMAQGYKPGLDVEPAYIVEPVSDKLNGMYQFAFLEKRNGGLTVAAIADVDHRGDSSMGKVIGVKIMGSGVTPSDQDAKLYSAYEAARKAALPHLCQAIYNHVVIPYWSDRKLEYYVYFLMSSNKDGEIPVSRHVLVRVADDAKTVLEVKPLSKSCMMATQRKDVAALEFSDLVLNYPSAVQAFLMWRYQIPVYVITKNGFLWAIDSRGIRLLSEGKQDK